MPRNVNNSEDLLDSRDIIARIAELEGAEDETEREELAVLEALADEAEGCGDWEHGEMLIRDSYFREYAMQLAEDIGALDSEARWPATCIDWDEAARELQHDYAAVDFDGVTYWLRS